MQKLYRATLKKCFVPASDTTEALDRLQSTLGITLTDEHCILTEVICGEDVFKLYQTTRLLTRSEQFDYQEIVAMVHALSTTMGYNLSSDEVADAVLVWVERLDGLDDDEFLDFLNA